MTNLALITKTRTALVCRLRRTADLFLGRLRRGVGVLARTFAQWLRLDAGMSTAEYAVGTVAAVAFAALLYKVIRSDTVQSALTGIIKSALSVKLG